MRFSDCLSVTGETSATRQPKRRPSQTEFALGARVAAGPFEYLLYQRGIAPNEANGDD